MQPFSCLFVIVCCILRNMKKSRTFPRKQGANIHICRGLFWIEAGGELFLGKGRTILLEGILQTGSICLAAKAMGITYKHAIKFIDSMNSHAAKPLVVIEGNPRNSIASVTAEGKKAIRLYRKYYAEFDKFLRRLEKEIDFS
jgi:molybdate transport system regulatory protein